MTGGRAPKPTSYSRVTLARIMGAGEANLLGNVHGGVIMKAVDNIQICPPRPAQAALAWAIPELIGWRRERAR